MIVRNDIPDHKLVLGCIRDGQVHTGVGAFQLFASGFYSKILTVAEVKFMVACNAGHQWEQLLIGQPLFGIDENNSPCFVEGGLIIPKELAAVPVTETVEPTTETADPATQTNDVHDDCAVCL